jgi:hypothetical protein
VRLARQQQRQPGRFLAGQPEHQLLERGLLALPVVVGALEGDRQARLAADVAVRPGAGRPLLEPLLPLLVPLGLADDSEIAGARRRVRHDRGRPLEAEHDLVVVDRLDLLDLAPEPRERRGGFRTHHQRMRVDDVLRGERPVAEVELHALAQVERPVLEVGAGRPLLGQAWRVLAGLRIHLEQRLEERVVLQMVGARDDPEAVALVEAGGGEDQLLRLGVLGDTRGGDGRHGEREDHRRHQDEGNES